LEGERETSDEVQGAGHPAVRYVSQLAGRAARVETH